MGMGGSGNTGADDTTYNLVSIVYHALQGAETYEKYIQDAEQGGNRDLAQFFRQVQQENRQRAEQGCRLLAQVVGQQGQQGGGARSGQHVQGGMQSGQQGGQSGQSSGASGQYSQSGSGMSGQRSQSGSSGQQSQSGGGSTQQGVSGQGSGRGGSSGGNANR